MTVNARLQKMLIETVAQQVIAHADELTRLDQAIGDGDHGINMRRGFEAVLSELPVLSEKSLPEALKAIGTKLVMTVGGASGPLYGTLFLGLGRALPVEPSGTAIAEALASAIDAVKARGKSDVGQKTMLDVLAPVLEEVRSDPHPLPERLRAVAVAAAEATIPMKAIRGRASFLGERSIGHMDPGARSTALMVEAIADVMEGKT
jgi:phosphoenolpyruvate---glycerone phosphotransferase subunit DhaL